MGLLSCSPKSGEIPTASPSITSTSAVESTSAPLSSETGIILEDSDFKPTAALTPTNPPELVSNDVITIWHGLDDAGVLALGDIIDIYQRFKPGTQFNLTYVPHDDLYDRYLNAASSGNGPTIMLGDGLWGPSLFTEQALQDMATLISPGLLLNLNPVAVEVVSYDDSIIGLPYSIFGTVMYRNTSIIPEYPTTIIDLISFSQTASRGTLIGAYLEREPLFAIPQLSACDGNLIDPEGFPAFNNMTGLCWMELLRLFEEAGPISNGSDDDYVRFKSGSVGVIFEGTWNARDLYNALGEDLVMDTWPEYKNSHLSGFVWTENIYVNPNLAEKDLKSAVAFVEYLLTPGTQSLFAQAGKIPSLSNVELSDPLISQSIAALSFGIAYPAIPEIQYYWGPIQFALDEVLLENADPSLALQSASESIIDKITNQGE